SPDGRQLIYSTYLGGADEDRASEIAVDAQGRAYVAGYTHSYNFPTTPGAFDRSFIYPDGGEAFITRLSADGSALDYSTFLGGDEYEDADGLSVDSAGNAYVTGQTSSNDFPTTLGSYDRTFGGYSDVYIAKVAPAGDT